MRSVGKIEEIMGVILIIGTLLAVILVMIGGTLYLIDHGGDLRSTSILSISNYPSNFREIINGLYTSSALAIIELGLLVLVGIQLLRVGLLVIYYLFIADYYFTVISLFIFAVLIYSSLAQPSGLF